MAEGLRTAVSVFVSDSMLPLAPCLSRRPLSATVALPLASAVRLRGGAGSTGAAGSADWISHSLYYIGWFALNYVYTLFSKLSTVEAGGKEGGLMLTIAVMQVGVSSAYGVLLWAVGWNPIALVGLRRPTRQPIPRVTGSDLTTMAVLFVTYAAAHSSGVIALNVGSPSFGQVVKAAEPLFSAIINTLVYATSPSLAQWCCLPLVVAGVAVSTLKHGPDHSYGIELDTTALIAGCLSNTFAAVRGAENKRIMQRDGGLKQRLGGTGNQFGLTNIFAFLASLPVMVAMEGDRWPRFVELLRTNANLRYYLLVSGVVFYLYNELATLTIQRSSAVTASVANTAKRAFVIAGVALALGKELRDEEKVGAALAIGAVLLYSTIDSLLGPQQGSVGAGAKAKATKDH